MTQERMTGAEFAAHRCRLGLTLAEMGEQLNVRPDTVQKWESEREPVPYRVPDELAELHREQAALAEQWADADTPTHLHRGDGWELGAAAHALGIKPSVMFEWAHRSDDAYRTRSVA